MACPFLGSLAKIPRLSDGGGKCPFGFGASKEQSAQQKPAEEKEALAEAPAATCPYGFSSAASAGPKLSVLHCTLCKSFLHDCVSIEPCGHKFCRGCVSRWRDCPVCGQDVESLQPDTDTQVLVHQFLVAHTLSPSVQAAKPGSGSAGMTATAKLPDLQGLAQMVSQVVGGGSQGSAPSASAFFLQLGLAAMASGNVPSALDRLELCKRELLKEAARELAGGTTTISSTTTTSSTNSSSTNNNTTSSACPEAALEAAAAIATSSCTSGQETDGAGGVQPPQTLLALHSLLLLSGSPDAAAGSGTGALRTSESTPAPLARSGGSSNTAGLTPGVLAAIPPPVAVQLGSVFGSQADACARVGDTGSAAALYGESVAVLRPAAGGSQPNPEACHALCVSINKLGDLRYRAGDLAGARACYEEALTFREGRAGLDAVRAVEQSGRAAGCDTDEEVAAVGSGSAAADGSGRGKAGCGKGLLQPAAATLVLDVAASLIKVGDVAAAAGDVSGAAAALSRARALVAGVAAAAQSGQAEAERRVTGGLSHDAETRAGEAQDGVAASAAAVGCPHLSQAVRDTSQAAAVACASSQHVQTTGAATAGGAQAVAVASGTGAETTNAARSEDEAVMSGPSEAWEYEVLLSRCAHLSRALQQLDGVTQQPATC